MNIEIVEANYHNQDHARDIVFLMNAYAIDPMGGGTPLSAEVKNNLVVELAKRSFAFSVISYVDGVSAGLINCFESFSTFLCQPLVNIHDIVVLEEFRRAGLSHQMLDNVEQIAIKRGCCKLTLEVLEGNQIAKASYRKFGFSAYELDPKMGGALFWQKKLGSI